MGIVVGASEPGREEMGALKRGEMISCYRQGMT